jgi:hypothetical protein
LLNDEESAVLIAAVTEIERHVAKAGSGQPARLFALVRTDQLIAAEPSLAAHLDARLPDSLSSVEQDEFHAGDDLGQTLARITWPASVAGCALAVERLFLPSQYEAEIPADPVAAERFVSEHPHRQEIRVVVGALRGGVHHGVARLTSEPDELLGATDLVPGLAQALAATLE